LQRAARHFDRAMRAWIVATRIATTIGI